MGFRFRKSINLGGGFKINLSKSGIGYSWGFPGYRITKTANGNTRKTYSIPGTGISYVDTNKQKKTKEPYSDILQPKTELENETVFYHSNNLEEMRDKDELLKRINTLNNINTIATYFICSILFLFVRNNIKTFYCYIW